MNNAAPGFQQTLQIPGRIRGAGRRQSDNFSACLLSLITVVETFRRSSVSVDILDLRYTEDPFQLCRDDVADTAVTGACNLTAFDHIPKGDPIAQKQLDLLFFRDGKRFLRQF